MLAAALAGSPVPAVSPAAPAPADVDRLVHAARLWGQVRYYHPWILTRDVDWDAAFVHALPRIEGERDERAGLQALLDELHDPVTAMVADPPESAAPKPAAASAWKWQGEPGGILSVKLERLAGLPEMKAEVAKLQPEAARARALVVDLRAQPPIREGVEDVGDELAELLGELAPKGLAPPTERVVQQSGYRTQFGRTSGEYSTGLLAILPAEIPEGKSPSSSRRIALVVDASSPMPPAALAFQRAGLLDIFSEGPIDERSLVRSRVFDLGPGLRARIRTGELDPAVRADVETAAGRGESAALAWLGRKDAHDTLQSSRRPDAPRPPPVWRPDKTYPEMLAPDRAHRLLALVRFWNVIDLFYPYKRLLDRPWESVLREFVPRFAQAEGADAYARAVLEVAAQIQDSHVWVDGKAVNAITGEAAPGLGVQWIDGLPVVFEILDPAAVAGGVREGDVIEEVDGEPLIARVASFEKYSPSSRPLGRRGRALFLAMAGPDGSAVTLKLRGEGGARTVTLKRGFSPRPSKPAFRLLDGNIGYIDLTRLTKAEVGPAFDKLGSTKALVLDMRGYPRGTAWPIAPRLNVKKATGAAWFERRFLSGDLDEGYDGGTFKFQQSVPTGETGQAPYRGRVVMLINEHAISQSEHSGLFFETVTDVTYVGSPTAGANGDVTVLTLPGGLSISFTGHDVRHADGRQLQRIGLEPHVPVRPTLAGIRAGRDEVLERALKFLTEGK